MRPTRFATEIGWLLQTGLIVFIVTPTIGIINGTKIFGTLSRDVLLTHVHSGTLGWITLGAMAMVLWLFGPVVPAAKDRNTRTLALLSAGDDPAVRRSRSSAATCRHARSPGRCCCL